MDSIQQRLTSYACDLNYDSLSPEAIHAAKVSLIDTLGALFGGFSGAPCLIARNLAARMPNPDGATVIGTQMKTTPDMAAFVNGATARYAEIAGRYDLPGSFGAHASDAVMPVLAAAEHVRASGREFITSVVLAYEVCSRISHFFKNEGFDNTNLSCLGTAVAAGKVLGLTPIQLSHCIAMAVVPNVILKQVKRGQKTMFKTVASGQAARAGVFAALLARAGMEGPHLPFEGKAGWCDHVAGARFSLDTMGGGGIPYSILDTRIKNRPAAGPAIASILAAEKVAPLNIKDVQQITVEVHKMAKERTGTGGPPWNLASREDADHSTPYLVAITLRDGTVTLRSFSDARLWDPELRALMQKIEVVENEEFTKAYQRLPQQNHARVIVTTSGSRRLVGESGGDADDLSAPKSGAQIDEKFRGLAEDYLGANRVKTILRRLWSLEEVNDVAGIPPLFNVVYAAILQA